MAKFDNKEARRNDRFSFDPETGFLTVSPNDAVSAEGQIDRKTAIALASSLLQYGTA